MKMTMPCLVVNILKCPFHRRYRHYFWISLIFLYIFVGYVWQTHKKAPVLGYVVVHFDLKGAPPKMYYLVTLLRVLRHYGVNAILMEYEDMFPFDGNLKHLKSEYSYRKQELRSFLKIAKIEGFTIIPLVQTFGHMEYVLKHEEFENLRENPDCPDSICPSKNQSREVLQDILTQIIEFHEREAPLQYIHIGCNLVHRINHCASCRDRNLTNLTIFKDHVSEVVDIVHKIQHELKILIWDDMLRGSKVEFLGPMKLDIEPVSGHYASSVEVKPHDLYNYQVNFKNIWIASAFKGADGESLYSPNLSERFQNHYSWMQLLHRYSRKRYNFKGIILTGWSRYNHTAPLYELLIPSIPSLITNLMLVNMFKLEKYDNYSQNWMDFFKNCFKKDFSGSLACKVDDQFLTTEEIDCSYPGRSITEVLIAYKNLNRTLSNFMIEDFSRTSKFSNYSEEILHNKDKKLKAEIMKKHIDFIQLNLWKVLAEFYPAYVASEYVVQHTKDLKEKVAKILMKTYANKNRLKFDNITTE